MKSVANDKKMLRTTFPLGRFFKFLIWNTPYAMEGGTQFSMRAMQLARRIQENCNFSNELQRKYLN